MDIAGKERLCQIGEYGLDLCGHSFEPSTRYFQGIEATLDSPIPRQLELIENTGKVISERFQQAFNLVADYFTTVFLVARSQDVESFTSWISIATDMTRLGRNEARELLSVSQKYPQINWMFAAKLYQASVRNGQEYASSYGQMMHRLVGVETEFDRLIFDYTIKNLPIKGWLTALEEMIPELSAIEVKILIHLLSDIQHPELAEALVKSCRQLPLDNLPVMKSWLSQGLELAPLNFEACIAFIRIESAKSVELLETLRGQVRFSDEQRTLQLYSEALVGKRLRLESNVTQDEDFRNLPSSDGSCIFLPEVVSYYPRRDENFRWLKVALSHQLGCYEFGTFDFCFNDSHIPFADFFRTFEEPHLAAQIFRILEDGRVDWLVQRHYKGIASDIAVQKLDAIESRKVTAVDPRKQLLEALQQYTLDGSGFEFVAGTCQSELPHLLDIAMTLKQSTASVFDTMDAVTACYEVLSQFRRFLQDIDPVAYRGMMSLDKVRMNLELALIEEADIEFSEDDEDGMSMTGLASPDDIDVDELTKGDVQEAMAIIITDPDVVVAEDIDHVEEPGGRKEFEKLKEERRGPIPETAYKYDEWDHSIDDYRKRWCTLYEIRQLEVDDDFVPDTLNEYRSLANRVRKQLNMLRPELLRKVKGMLDGEELDLERTIEAIVDRKSGASPSENIYIQRQRKDRDVSALFLLDMSASTDDAIVDPNAEPVTPDYDDDEFMHGYFDQGELTADTRHKIIDLEKESVVLMAEALQGLGDSYSVCGFSGYGKDRIEYFVCKDFDEPYNHKVKGRIGGIKPCRSTRMGPAIRHATKMLAATESRVKALIIISDGYPQDFDYGADRSSKDYGIKDTTKALSEANQKGVQSFCLTVDPSGHDYLREMCPDQQYMVMQDITQLPNELSKIYRGLTT